MKEALVSIRGVIGPGGFDWWTLDVLPDTTTDVFNQLQSQKPFTRIRVEIDSEGGYVSTGRAVRMLLQSQHVPITTVAYAQCMSIATEIFSIGNTRQMMKGCDFMIHKPYGGVMGNEDDIAAYLESIQNATQEMVDIYVAITGKSEKEVRAWLVRDKSMTAEQAVQNGFATEVIYEFPFNKPAPQDAQARTHREPMMAFNQKKTMEKNPLQAIGDKLTEMKNDILSALGQLKSTTKALALTTSDGKAVNVETSENNPATGDVITVDGKKPEDGDLVMSDNQIITVADGKITSIKAPEEAVATETATVADTVETVSAEVEAELVALRTENTRLTALLATERAAFQAQKTTLETKFTALSTQLETVGKSIHSTYNPESRKFESKVEDEETDRVAKSNKWKEEQKAKLPQKK